MGPRSHKRLTPQFRVEALELPFALLLRALVVDLRGAAPRARIIGRLAGGWRDLLLVMQLLLPASLVDFELARRLAAEPLRVALLLKHAQLQLMLLLPALQLVALQIALRRITAGRLTGKQSAQHASCKSPIKVF